MDFKTFKKNSNKNIEKLVGELDKMKSGGAKFIDDRFWTVPMDDKVGNGTALIRFLPACGDNKLAWVSLFSHAFQGPGGWYIENSLTSLGQPDPVSEANSALWATGIEANKTLVRNRKRKQSFISNILVLSDTKKPENEGKIFLFKYGKKIFQKIQDKIAPEVQFEGQVPVDPFDFWTGANFRLIVKKVEGYPNYDNSFFENPSPLLGGDDTKLENIWKAQYDLSEFTSPNNFKSYDDLKTRFDRVLGNVAPSKAASTDKPKTKPVTKVADDDADNVPWSEGSQSPVVEEDDGDLKSLLEKLTLEDED